MKTSFFYYWEVLWQMPQELWVLSFPIQLGIRTIWFPNEFRGKYRDIWRPICSLPIKLSRPQLPKSPSVSVSLTTSTTTTSTDSDSSSTEDEIFRHTTPPRIPQHLHRISRTEADTKREKKSRRKWSVYKYVQSWFFTDG
jgi:hypothetical protein